MMPTPIRITCVGCGWGMEAEPLTDTEADADRVSFALIAQAKREGWTDLPDWRCPRCRDRRQPRLPGLNGGT